MFVTDTNESFILPVPFRVSWACHRSTVTKSSQPFPLARYFAPLGALRLLYIMRGRRQNLLFNPLGEKLCQCVNSWILKKHFIDCEIVIKYIANYGIGKKKQYRMTTQN